LPAKQRAEEGATLSDIEEEDRAELLAKAAEKAEKKREAQDKIEENKAREVEAAEAEERQKNGTQSYFWSNYLSQGLRQINAFPCL
jgi:hypothetical protein